MALARRALTIATFALLAAAPAPASAAADLSISKTDMYDPVVVGSTFPYVVRVENLGDETATGIVVSDVLPSGVRFSSGSGCAHAAGSVTCAIASLAPGAGRTLLIGVKATAAGTVFNTATVTSATPDADPSNDADSESTDVLLDGCTITGTSGSDVLTGTRKADVICGAAATMPSAAGRRRT